MIRSPTGASKAMSRRGGLRRPCRRRRPARRASPPAARRPPATATTAGAGAADGARAGAAAATGAGPPITTTDLTPRLRRRPRGDRCRCGAPSPGPRGGGMNDAVPVGAANAGAGASEGAPAPATGPPTRAAYVRCARSSTWSTVSVRCSSPTRPSRRVVPRAMRSWTDSTTERPSGWNSSGFWARDAAIRAAVISICTRHSGSYRDHSCSMLGLAPAVVALGAGDATVGATQAALGLAGAALEVVALVERPVRPLVLDEERARPAPTPRTPAPPTRTIPACCRGRSPAAPRPRRAGRRARQRRQPGLAPDPPGVGDVVGGEPVLDERGDRWRRAAPSGARPRTSRRAPSRSTAVRAGRSR